MRKQFKIAKKILKLNPEAGLSGTLMLMIRGIDMGHDLDKSDVDIIINDYAPSIKLPSGYKVLDLESGSDGGSAKYDVDGVKVDVLSSGEKLEMFNGWRLAAIGGLIKAKISYVKNETDPTGKHLKDLKILGVITESIINGKDELPF